MNRNKVRLVIPPSTPCCCWLLVMRPAIERDADLGGGRESKVEACRFIRRKESSEGRERVGASHSVAGTGHHQTAAQMCGDGNLLPPLPMPRSCVFVFALLVLVVVRLGVLEWPWSQFADHGLGKVTIVILCLSANIRAYKFELIDRGAVVRYE